MCRSRDNRSIACAHLEPELISTTIRSARRSRRLSTRNRPARPFSSNRPSGSTNIHTSSQAARTDGSAFARAGRAIVDKPNTIKRRNDPRCCQLSHISKSIGTSAAQWHCRLPHQINGETTSRPGLSYTSLRQVVSHFPVPSRPYVGTGVDPSAATFAAVSEINSDAVQRKHEASQYLR
jgi:hypothetical protein